MKDGQIVYTTAWQTDEINEDKEGPLPCFFIHKNTVFDLFRLIIGLI
ncbi:hypothetical protein ACFPFV_11375 [Salinicoccus siamensis]